MTDDNFQYQLSISLPPSEQYAKGDMVNIRGKDAGEFLNNLLNFDEQMAATAAKVVADVRAQWTVIRDLGGQPIQTERSQAQTPPQNSQNAAQQPQGQQQGNYQGQQQNGPQNGYQGQPQGQGGYQNQQPQGQQPQGGYQGDPNQPPSSPPPHVGAAPHCSHGQRNFIAKNYTNGRPGYWMAWACPADRHDPSQHDLEFIQQRRN